MPPSFDGRYPIRCVGCVKGPLDEDLARNPRFTKGRSWGRSGVLWGGKSRFPDQSVKLPMKGLEGDTAVRIRSRRTS